MKHILMFFCCSHFIMSCSNISFKEKEYIELHFIGLVFSNYFIDSIENMQDVGLENISLFYYINNETSDSIDFEKINATLSYYNSANRKYDTISFSCDKLCPPLRPGGKRYIHLLPKKDGLFDNLDIDKIYNDSLMYLKKLNDVFRNSSHNLQFNNRAFNYSVSQKDIIVANDFLHYHLDSNNFYTKRNVILRETSPYKIERIYNNN